MAQERAEALVIRGTDWSENSRIVTLWSREFGKLRGLAKGGRRLKSSFETSLDLLNVVEILFIRKASDGLDLMTEARVRERFPSLRRDLASWYAGLYVAELLGDWTQDHDPHPLLYEEAVRTLRELEPGGGVGPRVAQFELVLLRELGYGPALEHCAACNAEAAGKSLAFSPARGGVLCDRCSVGERDRLPLSPETHRTLVELRSGEAAWRGLTDPTRRADVRRLLNEYVTYALGRRPRLMQYLGS